MSNRNLYDCIHISIPSPLRFKHLSTGKRVNHGGEYGLEIPANFHFNGPGKANKLAKR